MRPSEQVFRDIIHQTDPRLPETFQRFGCRAACLMAIPQFVAGRALGIGQFADIIERGMGVPGVFTSELYRTGSDEHWLIDETFRSLGVARRGRQVGWTPDHMTSVQWEYMIAHWRTSGPDGHFTLHDRAQHLIYDPHDPAQAGYALHMQTITRRLVYRTWETGGTA